MEEATRGTGFRATAEQWQGLLEECCTSGKSIRGYCRERGIPHRQMYYYLRRARKANACQGFIELEREREAPGGIWIEAGRCRIRVKRGFDAELLREVAEALS
jgi:hypothetical protein